MRAVEINNVARAASLYGIRIDALEAWGTRSARIAMSALQEQLQRALVLVARAARVHARCTASTGFQSQGAYARIAAVQHALHTASAALRPSTAAHRGASGSAWRQQRGVTGSRGFSAEAAVAAAGESGIIFSPQAVEVHTSTPSLP